jgi:hypothetical protein
VLIDIRVTKPRRHPNPGDREPSDAIGATVDDLSEPDRVIDQGGDDRRIRCAHTQFVCARPSDGFIAVSTSRSAGA